LNPEANTHPFSAEIHMFVGFVMFTHSIQQQLADQLSRLLVLADSFFKLWQFCGIETLEMISV
jgi:hypothetical protein